MQHTRRDAKFSVNCYGVIRACDCLHYACAIYNCIRIYELCVWLYVGCTDRPQSEAATDKRNAKHKPGFTIMMILIASATPRNMQYLIMLC